MQLKIMTFNTQHCLNYLTTKIDYEIMAKTIQEQSPDIVSLNEMRGEGPGEGYDAQVDILAEKTGMHGYFAEAISFDGQNPYGNGLLSRFPILSAKTIPILCPEVRPYKGYYEDRCLLKAVLDVEGEMLTVMVIHVGLNPDEAERAIDTVLKHLPSERCVLMGDFNLTPDSPFIERIKERMKDAAAYIRGECATYPSDAPNIKIDSIFVTEDITVEDAKIPATVASDHRPHTAALKI
jgi:endonuclease/exonuclease/phosphatase family metal-dependent hydrolase